AYCTGFWRGDGRAFGVMRSRDLVRWHELGGALEMLPGENPCYWAPEVSYREGKFLMYYSAGNETLMHVRVAVAGRPEGPFVDSGHRLTNEEFAIDPHVFADRDGERYLFYATDFLDYTHVGTGTVVDRMIDDFTLEGRPLPVTRARFDWQVYDPARKEKGGVRWHTVEGPFVLERKGRYYEMFSGGNWQNVSYGVSYATSESVLRDGEWEQHADGEKVLPILRTIPGSVVGPGHNSVVIGPDNRQLFCVYHRWADEGRVLAIDRMEFVGDSLVVLGPTTTPQHAPVKPWFADYFDEPREEGLGEGWECASGRWSVRGGEARQESGEGEAEARCGVGAESFVAEVTLRAVNDGEGGAGAFGVSLHRRHSPLLRCAIRPGERRAALDCWADGGWASTGSHRLPTDFRPQAFHHLRVEVDDPFFLLTLDGGEVVRWQTGLSVRHEGEPDAQLSLFTENLAAAFRGFSLTRGFADEFIEPAWTLTRGLKLDGEKRVGAEVGGQPEGKLLLLSPGETFRRASDILADGSYELVINLRMDDDGAGNGGRACVLSPGVASVSGAPSTFALERGGGGAWSLRYEDDGVKQSFALPGSFSPHEFQQFRFRRERGRLSVQVGAEVVCEVAATKACGALGIAAGESPVAVDLVRLTAIRSPKRSTPA
ncbi:MAG: glycoside hydrolase family 43 protein, partial [Pyrinomonadaceae bacterium]